jgi:hypothetical protein
LKSYLDEKNNNPRYRSLTPEETASAHGKFLAIADNIEKVIVGKRSVVELIVLCLTAGGHVLIEDIPGVGKTSLVNALARSVDDCGYKRIQFTSRTSCPPMCPDFRFTTRRAVSLNSAPAPR